MFVAHSKVVAVVVSVVAVVVVVVLAVDAKLDNGFFYLEPRF